MTLPTFGFVAIHVAALADGIARETEWTWQVAETQRAAAHLWRGANGLVVPRSYERLPRWAEACAASAQAGWPVQVRTSGGGLVPQCAGVWNLSLIWPAPSAMPIATESVYRSLTGELAGAFGRLGITAAAQAVEGSFCDGRFNLAVNGRKCVGTAQAWRRVEGKPIVLAHAVVVVTADPGALTDVANRFELLAGSTRRYRANALTSLAEAWVDAHPETALPEDFEHQVVTVIAERFARLVPPGGAVGRPVQVGLHK